MDISELFILRKISRKFYLLLKTYMLYYVKNLQFTALEHILTKKSFVQIISHFQNIEEISLCNCWKALDTESMSILTLCCPKLLYLDVSNCRGINSRGMSSIAYFCTELVVINLSNCYNIDQESVILVASGCPRIEQFYACSCFGVTDYSLVFLLEACPKLQTLDVAYCLQLTNLFAEYLLRLLCCSLKMIRVTGCNNVLISDNIMYSFSSKGISVNFFY